MGYWGTKLTGYEKTGVCWWCGGEIKGRRKTFCFHECRDAYFRYFAWGQAGNAVKWALERCHGKCEGCGVTGMGYGPLYRWDDRLPRLNVHHVVPIGGRYDSRAYNLKNLPYNLRVYCPECHGQHRDDANSILGLQIAEYLALDAQIAQKMKIEDRAAAVKRV